MSNKLIDKLNQGPVICAEGFLFEIERRGYLSAGEFVPTVALDRPDVLEALFFSMQVQILFKLLPTMFIGKKLELRVKSIY